MHAPDGTKAEEAVGEDWGDPRGDVADRIGLRGPLLRPPLPRSSICSNNHQLSSTQYRPSTSSPPPAPPARGSSPPGIEDPEDLVSYMNWYKSRYPAQAQAVEACLTVLIQEIDSLSTLEAISEDRIARHGLPAGLMLRMKAGVKTWRRMVN